MGENELAPRLMQDTNILVSGAIVFRLRTSLTARGRCVPWRQGHWRGLRGACLGLGQLTSERPEDLPENLGDSSLRKIEQGCDFPKRQVLVVI